jgi:hypothetical protein
MVGFVHESGSTTTTNLGGIYDKNGTKIQSLSDFKFSPTAQRVRHRNYLYEAEDTSGSLNFYSPTIYKVNGQEPSVQELLNGPSPYDTQDPTPPTLSGSAQNDTSVQLSWTGATDNTGVTGYKVYSNGNLAATVGNVSNHTLNGLTASTTYSFTVKALDAAGNESSQSNNLSLTTPDSEPGSGSTGIWSKQNTVASYAGEVAIGTAAVPSGYKMAVEGKIRTREIRVDQDSWPDYVFNEGYDLPTLEEIQKHIQEKGHLPNIPSAAEVEANGLELGEMNRLLLEKIEELTLHIIRQQSEIDALKEKKHKP